MRVIPDLKLSAVIELYMEGEISLGKAAELAGVTTIKFKDILANRGICRKIEARSIEELKRGTTLIKKLRN